MKSKALQYAGNLSIEKFFLDFKRILFNTFRDELLNKYKKQYTLPVVVLPVSTDKFFNGSYKNKQVPSFYILLAFR